MDQHAFYQPGSRELQDHFDSRRLADRLAETLRRDRCTDDDRAFIEAQSMFFLATADADGFPDCSYKGGAPGFVRVLEPALLAFPSYDGNGMFRSLGNIRANPQVALLFIDFAKPKRLRLNGEASVHTDDPLLALTTGAQAMVRVSVRDLFPNCPRYIHRLQQIEASPYVPAPGVTPPVPAWKTFPQFNDVLPKSDPARGSNGG